MGIPPDPSAPSFVTGSEAVAVIRDSSSAKRQASKEVTVEGKRVRFEEEEEVSVERHHQSRLATTQREAGTMNIKEETIACRLKY